MTIDVHELVVHHGSVRAVDHVSLRVERSETLALLGPNGAGKTSLIETIEGYRVPDGGTVRVLGLDPANDRPTLAPRWGVMPQAGGLPMGVTVGEAVRLFARLHGRGEGFASILDATGLTALSGRRWRRLSGGEQQRLSLALALCGGAEVLLLDEPTAAVDAAGREQILELVQHRAASGAAVIITTHRFDDVERVADRAVILDHGRAVAQGALDSLTATNDRIEFRSRPGMDVSALGRAIEARVIEDRPGRYRVESTPAASTVAAINSWLDTQGAIAESMLAGRRTLEDVFLELTGDRTMKDQG